HTVERPVPPIHTLAADGVNVRGIGGTEVGVKVGRMVQDYKSDAAYAADAVQQSLPIGGLVAGNGAIWIEGECVEMTNARCHLIADDRRKPGTRVARFDLRRV